MTILERLVSSSAPRRGIAVAAVLLGLAVRLAWPDADPPARLSWSSGILTDPPGNTLAAKNAALHGEWDVEDYYYRYSYPAMEGLTWVVYEIFGVSRRSTVVLAGLLGFAGLAVIAAALRRRGHAGTALAFFALGAASYWHAMFSRIPLTENGVALFLALSSFIALRPGTRSILGAGALAAFAVLFGKYHAVGFLPALALFYVLRERSARPLLPLATGAGAVFLLWLIVLFLPHRAEILAHVQRQSVGTHGTLPFLESPLNGLLGGFRSMRQAWVHHQAPVIGALGGLFAIWTLGNGSARRERLKNGTALFALWFVSMWLYYSLLPYRAPRYFVLIGLPLLACAAAQLAAMARGASAKLRRPRGLGEWIPLALWLAFLGYGVADVVNHWVVMFVEHFKPGHDATRGVLGALVKLNLRMNTFEQCLGWGAAVAGVLLVVAAILPAAPRARRARFATLPRLAFFLGGLALVGNATALGSWSAKRSYVIEETQGSLDRAIADEAVVFGNFGPLLTQNSARLGLPYFESLEGRDLLASHGITHLAVELPRGLEEFRSRYPGLLERLELIQVWPFRTRFVQRVALFRLPPDLLSDYELTLFERAMAAVRAAKHEEALDLVAQARAEAGEATPDLLSCEAISRSALGDDARARELLLQAIELRPYDSHLLLNLGLLAYRRGDQDEAREIWTRGLRYDPYNADLAARLETVPAAVGDSR